MSTPKPRIHLDQLEIIVVFSLFVLVAGMMFTLGVLVGHGMGTREVAVQLTASAEQTVGHGGHEKHESSRRPASEGHSQPGGELRKAFRDSKQSALTELALRETSNMQPKSVLDSEAHLNSHSEWDRKPAADQYAEQNNRRTEALRKAEVDREAGGLPPSVKHLFERKPSAVDRFVPGPGTFTVQIASYASADESTIKVSQLRKAGFNDAYAETTHLKNGEAWYRVGVGSYAKSVWADKTGEKLVKRGLARDYVIRQVQ